MVDVLNGKYDRSLRVDGHAFISGWVAGDVTVGPGGSARIDGRIDGRVIVLAGGEAEITGMVGGVDSVGHLRIAVGAFVGDRVLGADGELRKPTESVYNVDDETPRFVFNLDGSLTPE
jgi:hypothetical protein